MRYKFYDWNGNMVAAPTDNIHDAIKIAVTKKCEVSDSMLGEVVFSFWDGPNGDYPLIDELHLNEWISSDYNEDTTEELNYYVKEKDIEIGKTAYLYRHEDDSLMQMTILAVKKRSDDFEAYDELEEEALIDGEDEYDADTSAEFITDNDCYLVWFRYDDNGSRNATNTVSA